MSKDSSKTSETTRSNQSISDQEKDWAQSALAEFNRNNFQASYQFFKQLEASRPNDFKVVHNKAVVEYFKSDLKKTDQFKKNLLSAFNQFRISIDDLETLEDVEHCIIYYNYALLLYHMQQHQAALRLINKVFSFIEPMEESLAHRVCLLSVELHLRTNQLEKALSLISYIETQFVSTENAMKMIREKRIKPLDQAKPMVLDAATDALRLKLLQFRARFYLKTGLVKNCRKDLKSLYAGEKQHITTPVFLLANAEYVSGNFRKAVMILNTGIPVNSVPIQESGESLSTMVYNNLGCVYYCIGKPNLASTYFHKALLENNKGLKTFATPDAAEPLSGRALHTLGFNKASQVLYNLGVSLLHAGKPIPAFDCLTEAVQVYHMNPVLWLRLAEACIMAYKSDNRKDFDLAVKRNEIVSKIVGSGAHRKIVLNTQIFTDIKYSSEAQSYAIPVAGLEFGSLCLKNALFLTRNGGDAPNIVHLRCHILAASAYVCLCLGDSILALNHANSLLCQNSLSGAHKFLGHLYAAEALIILGQLPEAMDHLKLDYLNDLSLPSPPQKYEVPLKPPISWFPNNLTAAKNILQYNLAVALVIKGELEKSAEVLKSIWVTKSEQSEIPVQVIALALYVELMLGHADIARAIVKQSCNQFR
ncbi:CCR4-NOT transcription complex subunit 10-B isoform X2 [Bemisia tabaci]